MTTVLPVSMEPFRAVHRATEEFRGVARDVATMFAGTLEDARMTIASTNARKALPVVLPVPLPGSRTLPVPMRVVIATDESGSTASSDPNRERQQATLTICDWLRSYSQDREDSIGLVRFADRATTVPAVRVVKARRAFETAFAGGVDVGGGTRLAPAIDALCQLLAEREPARGLAILITDGQVQESNAELWALMEQLQEHADAVYILGLDNDGAWSGHTQDSYQGLGLAGRIAISQPTHQNFAHAIATLLANEAGLVTR